MACQRSKLSEHLIANDMPVFVIDFFEVIKVEDRKAERSARGTRFHKKPFRLRKEGPT